MQGHVAYGTARICRLQIDIHLTPYFFFGDTDVRTIDLRTVQALYDHFLDIGRPRSAKSIDMALNALRLVLSYAIGQGIIEHNPVETWKRRRPRRRSSSTLQVSPSKVMSHEDLERVLEAARQDYPTFYPLILLLGDTGVRLGEAIALRWVDVDLETRTARICRSFSSGVRLGPTKTGRERTVELSSRLVMCLARIEPNVFPHPDDSLVFPNAMGGFLWAPNFRNKVFSKVIAKALGRGRHYAPHCLRHTWASLHMARGTPLKWIQEQGGWTTAKLLLDTYGHYMPGEFHGYADALSPAPDGAETAPSHWRSEREVSSGERRSAVSGAYEDEDESTGPRSPIMHFTDSDPKKALDCRDLRSCCARECALSSTHSQAGFEGISRQRARASWPRRVGEGVRDMVPAGQPLPSIVRGRGAQGLRVVAGEALTRPV